MSTTHQLPDRCALVPVGSWPGWHSVQLVTPWGTFDGGGLTQDAAVLNALRKSRREDGS